MSQKRVRRNGFHRAETNRMTRDQAMLKRKKERVELLKRRRRALIMAICAFVAAVILLIVFLLGGFEKKATETTLTIKSDGSIIFEEIDVVDSKASKQEIESFARQQISEYNDKSEKPNAIRFKKCSVSDGVAYLKTQYRDFESYSDFTGLSFFDGTIEAALKEGYDFQTSFVNVKGGEKADSAEIDAVTKDSSQQVVIIDQAISVVVPSDILYLSDEGTGVISSRKVQIGDPVESYIIYSAK